MARRVRSTQKPAKRNLAAQLGHLENAQLVRAAGEWEYFFKHTLTQETVYASLLKTTRREIHAQVAQTYEKLYAERLDEFAAQLAQHYAAANDDARALEYATRAGNHAARMYALPEAILHYTFALTLAQRLDAPRAALFRARGLAHEAHGDFERARLDQEAALKAGRAIQDRHAEWQALLDLGLLWAGRDYARTGEYYRQAFELARTMHDDIALAHSLNRMGNWHVNIEEPAEGRRCHEQALAIFQQQHDQPGIADTLDLLGMTNSLGGNLAQGTVYYQQVIPLFRKMDNRPGLISSLASLSIGAATYQTTMMVLTKFSLADAERTAETAVSLARTIGLRAGEAYALIILASVSVARGDFERALDLAQRSLAIAGEIEHRQWLALGSTMLGVLYTDLFALDHARQHLERGFALAQETGSKHWIRVTSGFLASVYILQNDLARAENILDAAFAPTALPQTLGQRLVVCARVELALAQGQPARALELLDHLIVTEPNAAPAGQNILRVSLLRGRALVAMSQWNDAQVAFSAARKIADEQGAMTLLWQSNAALAQIETQRGNFAQAREHRAQARAAIDFITAHTPSEWRVTFLNSPAVRAATEHNPY